MAHILVIDDDIRMLTALQQMLEREGYDVLEAPDGKVATGLYREQPVDLVITDILMPEKDGLEIIMELRRDLPDVKIIAISGDGYIESGLYLLNVAKILGANRTLYKPFTHKEMLEAVAEPVDGRVV